MENENKPVAEVTQYNGNVFMTLGVCMKALKRADLRDQAKEMGDRVMKSEDYDESLSIMGEYCDLE